MLFEVFPPTEQSSSSPCSPPMAALYSTHFPLGQQVISTHGAGSCSLRQATTETREFGGRGAAGPSPSLPAWGTRAMIWDGPTNTTGPACRARLVPVSPMAPLSEGQGGSPISWEMLQQHFSAETAREWVQRESYWRQKGGQRISCEAGRDKVENILQQKGLQPSSQMSQGSKAREI